MMKPEMSYCWVALRQFGEDEARSWATVGVLAARLYPNRFANQ